MDKPLTYEERGELLKSLHHEQIEFCKNNHDYKNSETDKNIINLLDKIMDRISSKTYTLNEKVILKELYLITLEKLK